MNKNPLVYIDFGGSRIKAIAGFVQDNHALKVMGEQEKVSDDVKSGIVEKISGAAFNVSKITRLLQNSLKLDQITRVSTSVNARTMKHFTTSVEGRIMNLVTEKLLKDLEKECIDEVESDKISAFECIPLAYYIDGQYIDEPPGKKGSMLRIDYNVIIGNKLVKESLERSIERTGIAVDYIHLALKPQPLPYLKTKTAKKDAL